MNKIEPVILEFHGFESLYGWDEDLERGVDKLGIPEDFQGTVKVTLEYIEYNPESEQDD